MEDKYLTKKDLVSILKQLNIPLNEGITADKILEKGIYPKITFWPYYHDFLLASNEALGLINTYQISILTQDDNFLIDLVRLLKDNKLFPHIEQEFLSEYNCWHFYFSLNILDKKILEN